MKTTKPSKLRPFGDPDGSRGDFNEVRPHFVEFDEPLVWRGLAMEADDHRARLLIGRKGSGKTVYLRRLQASAAQAHDLFAAPLEQSPPRTESIIQFALKMGSGEVVEMWSMAWQRAALRSLASHFLAHGRLRAKVSEDVLSRLQNDYDRLLKIEGPNASPLPVYSELASILNAHTSRNGYSDYLTDNLWPQLENDLAEALRGSPPIFFYLDNVDASFERAPSYWRDCQLGLFRTILELLRDHRFGNRFHLTAALRDIVYLRALESEHGTRFLDDEYIRVLDWDWHAAEHLLQVKTSRLDETLFTHPLRDGRGVDVWLGVSELHNAVRKVDEPIVQYLLRHTRLLPRDIVILGNRLCHEVESSKRFGGAKEGGHHHAAISQATHFASRHFGNEQLSIAAHHIAAELDHSYQNSNQVGGLIAQLKTWIKSLGRDRFSRKSFLEFAARGDESFSEGGWPVRALWLNGLLGYIHKNRGSECAVFYSDAHEGEYEIPFDRSRYALHSMLIDAIGIRASGKPVIQCSRSGG